jgi:L-seryl-tRNA(Ser) seleniumtransferase
LVSEEWEVLIISIYDQLGLKRVINAWGTMTMIGGSVMHREVVEAWVEASKSYVNMEALHARAGEIIAEITGAEAGLVTSGAAGALVLMAAACIAGNDRNKMMKLPHSEGMANEIIIPRHMSRGYPQAFLGGGARLVVIGDDKGNFTVQQIEDEISDNTIAIAILLRTTLQGLNTLKEIIAVGKQHGIPVIVDAAAELPPIENLTRLIAWGADLVAFSGGKDIMGPQNTGILCGRKDLIASAFAQSCPHHGVARPMKVSKEALVACLTAFKRYATLDHTIFVQQRRARVKYWIETLAHIPHIKIESIFPNPEKGEYFAQGWPRARVTLDEAAIGLTATDVAQALKDGNPAIYVETRPGMTSRSVKGGIVINPHCLQEGEEVIVADRLREILLA